MELIYLVGQISPKHEVTYQWRRNLETEFFGRPDIKFINPCDNPFNAQVLKEKEYAVSEERRVNAIDVLPAKDYTFCKRSTMAIVNMNHYDPAKPMLGSFFELGWYFTMPEKTVIGFAKDLNDYQVQHPFVQQAVTTWCNDEYEAALIIEKYFTTVEGL
jgi:nucleoside 2-deoxyribosyltransferase